MTTLQIKPKHYYSQGDRLSIFSSPEYSTLNSSAIKMDIFLLGYSSICYFLFVSNLSSLGQFMLHLNEVVHSYKLVDVLIS